MPERTMNTEELVSGGFVNLISALDRLADDIKLECAEATLEGQLERSGTLLEASKNMLAFRREVETLSVRWSKGQLRLPTMTAKKHKSLKIDRKIGPYYKSAKTQLRVTVAGQTINQDKATEVFSTVLERMGLERVAQLGMRLAGIALVSRHPATGYQSQSQMRKEGWYITTHASNADKKRMLEKISAALQIPVCVEIDA